MFLMDKAPVWVTVARTSGNQHSVGAGLVPARGDHEGRPYGKRVLHIGRAGVPAGHLPDRVGRSSGNKLAIFRTILVVMLMVGLCLPSAAAELLELPDGARVDLGQKCPVCDMIIGGPEGQGVTLTYREGRVVGFGGVAATVFKDGRTVGFDGARCLFVFNAIPSKYGVDIADMKDQYVTDFTNKKMIKIEKAFLVLGSAVKGRMGYEMIPFFNKRSASEFASQNDGKWIIQLHPVARETQSKEEPAAPPEGSGLNE